VIVKCEAVFVTLVFFHIQIGVNMCQQFHSVTLIFCLSAIFDDCVLPK